MYRYDLLCMEGLVRGLQVFLRKCVFFVELSIIIIHLFSSVRCYRLSAPRYKALKPATNKLQRMIVRPEVMLLFVLLSLFNVFVCRLPRLDLLV